MAKRKLIIDENFLNEVQTLAFQGLSNKQIHEYYGVSNDTWYTNYVKKYPEITERIVQGRSKGLTFVTSKLMEKIKAGSEKSIHFYLKCRGAWYDNVNAVIPEGEDPSSSIPLKLGTNDPIEAAKIYRKIMGEH